MTPLTATAECTVFSPCGRYRVHFTSDGVGELRVHVARSGLGQSVPSASPHFIAVLDEPQVLELTTAAGVRKSFKNFSELVYSALIGRASCVRFYVENCAEMKHRISADVRSRQQRQGDQFGRNESTSTGGGKIKGVKADESTAEDETIDLSVSSDLAEEVLAQRFLTIDYDVDFTRAVFPIPLDPCTVEVARGTASSSRLPQSSAVPLASGAAVPAAAAATPVVGHKEWQEAQQTMAQLRRENSRLREENAALVRLSKEKMLEMQHLCEDFQSKVQVGAEAEHLRGKNAELRVRLQELEEAKAAVERVLEAERRAASRRDRINSSGSKNREKDSNGFRGRAASGRGSEFSPQRGSPNPYLRSLSRGSGSSVHSRAPCTSFAKAGRPSSSSPSSHATRDSVRRPLVSPTPPPTLTRRSRSRGGGTAANGNRFDTPPGRAACVARQRSSVGGGGGGDSPAPRGRSGNRSLDDYPLLRKASLGNRQAGGCGSDAGSSRASSVHSSRSRASSASSTAASHDRLFHASTAASRSKQIPHASAVDTPHRRAVFR